MKECFHTHGGYHRTISAYPLCSPESTQPGMIAKPGTLCAILEILATVAYIHNTIIQ